MGLSEHTRTQKEKAKVVTKIVEKKSRQNFEPLRFYKNVTQIT